MDLVDAMRRASNKILLTDQTQIKHGPAEKGRLVSLMYSAIAISPEPMGSRQPGAAVCCPRCTYAHMSLAE